MASSPKRQLDPWVAVNLSVIWPGVGQCYGKSWKKGILLAIATATLLAYVLWSIFAAQGNTLTGLLLVLIFVILYIFNLFDAYNTLRPLPKPSFDIYQPVQNRWYAIFLSQVLPGLGHLYLQRAILGGVFLGSGTLTALLANDYPALLPIPPFIWAIACYHIYRTTPFRGAPYRWVIITVIIGLLITRLTVGYMPVWVNHSLLQCIVPSLSMEPTLQVNDRIFVRRNANYSPQRGEVIVFEVPEAAIATINVNPETLFVKRVIGLPGETVAIANGTVFINQKPLQESYLASSPAYDWGPMTVPPDAFFVLGDNRNQSADSHVWGFLPSGNILGKAYKIYWPPSRIQPLRHPSMGGSSNPKP